MNDYLITQIVKVQYSVIVQAEDEEDAFDKAYDIDLNEWREDRWDTILTECDKLEAK